MAVAFEASGVIDPQSRLLLKELSHRILTDNWWCEVKRVSVQS